ncbi:protein mab-21-like 3 isoform 3-T6 [Macrochelys suwanniensis]
MKPFTEEDVEFYIQNKVEQRHHLVSKTVDEVQKIIQQLTAEISYRDTRFQAISNSGVHNENFRDQPALLAKWSALLRGKRPFHPSVQVLAPSHFLITVPLRGLTGYREHQVRHWRYYTVHGAKLLSPVRDPEELQQWLEVEQFSKSLQQWHETEVNIEGDLVPAKVLAIFRELMEKSITSCNLSNGAVLDMREVPAHQGLALLPGRLPAHGAEAAQVREPALPEALLRPGHQPAQVCQHQRPGPSSRQAHRLPGEPRALPGLRQGEPAVPILFYALAPLVVCSCSSCPFSRCCGLEHETWVAHAVWRRRVKLRAVRGQSCLEGLFDAQPL